MTDTKATFILCLDTFVPELSLYHSDEDAAEILAMKDSRYLDTDDVKKIEMEILEKLATIKVGHSARMYDHRVVRVYAWGGSPS